MRTVKLCLHGATMATSNPPAPGVERGGKRAACKGWTADASRRNREWLRSIDDRRVYCTDNGELLQGWTVTLTLRDCPETPKAWHDLRRALFKRLGRAGMLRAHWLVEWQRRGVPHLHGMVWAPLGALSADIIIGHWCEVAAAFGALPRAQAVREVTDLVGWARYLAKHAARGVKHYQRSDEHIPARWTSSTGRMWGHIERGDLAPWPIVPPLRLGFESDQDPRWYRLRRLMRALARGQARREVAAIEARTIARALTGGPLSRKAALAYGHRHLLTVRARRLLKCPERARSSVRGPSIDAPQAVTARLFAFVAGDCPNA